MESTLRPDDEGLPATVLVSDVPDRASVTGAVLCGGASRRMGRDKALLELDGRTLIERSLEALSGVAASSLVACGPEPRYAQLGLPLALDGVPDGGPLAGLCAALEETRTPWLCVLACDMPRASADVLRALLARAHDQDLDGCLLRTPSGVEPLFGVYRSSCLEAVRAALARGERRMISFHGLELSGRRLRVGTLDARELPPALRDSALNLNTLSEYERERDQ